MKRLRRIPRHDRGGYAMMLVLMFFVLFLTFWSVAYRWTASELRIESVRKLQIQRDEGTMHALGRALALLETGFAPTNPYVCSVTVQTSTGSQSYTVTFTGLSSSGSGSVSAAPTQAGSNPPPMPLSFFSQ